MESLQWLRADPSWFPPSDCALDDPNGLLAVGGDLYPKRLINAYRRGIFPWYEAGQPILWWSPQPRMVIYPNKIHRSKSLIKHIRRCDWTVTMDKDFSTVIEECSSPRSDQGGTWITEEMKQAYKMLHQLGFAHSIEVWDETGKIAGGLYGVAIGKVFFGESMFSHQTNGSKVAISSLSHWLHQHEFQLLDCQVENPHLVSLGAKNADRSTFESILRQYCDKVHEKHTQDLFKQFAPFSNLVIECV